MNSLEILELLMYICHLRDKLEENPKQPKLIKTVRGLGYKLRDLKLNVEVSSAFITLISTITIISFIGLGAIIHNTIYQTLTSNQIKSLDSEARNYINLYNNNKEKEITNIAHNEKYHINKRKR